MSVNRRSRRSDAEIAIGMVERIHPRLVYHVLCRRRGRDQHGEPNSSAEKFDPNHFVFSSLSTQRHGSSENKTNITKPTFPSRLERTITLRRSNFTEHARSQ
jgi:hypothetical protein